MKRLLIVVALFAMAYPTSSSAIVGVGLGGSVGFASYSGDVLPASGDVGEGTQYGLILELSTLPVVDAELHLNYFEKDFTYSYDVGGVPVSEDFQFRDISATAIVKKNVMPVPMSPLKLYVGAGLGYHILNTEVAKYAVTNPSQADDPVALLENTGKTSVQGMLGVKLAPPVIPLAVYSEYRFGRIITENKISTSQFEAGIMMKF